MTLFTEEHHEAYQDKILSLPSYQAKSKEYQSLVYIITSTEELRQKAAPYLTNDGFSFDNATANNDFSSGTYELLKLGLNLYNNQAISNTLELIARLDDESFQLAMNAIYLRKYGVK